MSDRVPTLTTPPVTRSLPQLPRFAEQTPGKSGVCHNFRHYSRSFPGRLADEHRISIAEFLAACFRHYFCLPSMPLSKNQSLTWLQPSRMLRFAGWSVEVGLKSPSGGASQ